MTPIVCCRGRAATTDPTKSAASRGNRRVDFAARLVLASGLGLVLTSAACSEDRAGSGCAGGADLREPASFVVATESGRVRGTTQGQTQGQTQVFRGIPYAAPPVGELRFRPPRALAAWEGVRDATQFGSKCPQSSWAGRTIGDEDCLTLNIWRPATPAAQPRPVMLFIHGGGNVIGSGSDPLHEGHRLARTHDVIIVTINYRLGLLGFLAHPELTSESGTSGNWAYLDQIAALQWVSRNIAAFGGDPDRVTIFGESAGALGVCVLLASPLATGLFNAAIMQSGGCDVATLERRESEGRQLVMNSSCASKPNPIECLRSISAAKLVEMAPSVPDDISSWVLAVGGAVDGYVLPLSPWDSFAAGTQNVVPSLVGTNAHETEILTPTNISTCESYERAVRADFGSSAEAVLTEYPCTDYASGRHAYVDVTTDALFNCQARRVLRSLAPAADNASTPLFRYYYSYVRGDPAVTRLRAYHGAEIQMVFGTMTRLGYKAPEQELALSETMQTSWAALAAFGSPIHDATPGWEAYDATRDNALILDSPVAHADGVGTSHCDFWDARPNLACEADDTDCLR